jgi:hypothetical protein
MLVSMLVLVFKTMLMSSIIDSEPSSFEEAVGQHVWRDAMMEEYQSIMKNDV